MTLGKLREFILEAGGKIKIGAVGITYSSGGDIDVHINHNLVSWIDGDHGDSVEIEDVVPTTSDDFNMDVVRNLKNDIRDYGNQIGELKTKLKEAEEVSTQNQLAVGKVEAYEKLLIGRTVSIGS